MNEIETCSTIYHTSSGDIEIPNEVKATAKSRVAPLWLVFPEHIINTQHIIDMRLYDNHIEFITIKGHFSVTVTDIKTTWGALQKVFAEGVN
jgi:hypothetical protein